MEAKAKVRHVRDWNWDDPDLQVWFDEMANKPDPEWPFDETQAFDLTDAHPDVSFVSLGNCDCLAGMAEFPDACVDAVVTDPPYGMSINSKAWDKSVPGVPVWREVLRLLKPGGIMIAASHARTYHQLATVVELAGFDIMDMLFWNYDQSYPAGKNLGGQWQSLLKRAHEPWVVARKPLPVVQVPGRRAGKTKAKKLGLQETFDTYGTSGLRVVGNGQDGFKWASNSIKARKPRPEERGLGLNPAKIRSSDGSRILADQPNNHSTVKPLSLMRRLVRIVGDSGATILDPFAGSGTTGMAAMAEGMNFIGFEMEAESFDIFQQRVQFAHQNPGTIPPPD